MKTALITLCCLLLLLPLVPLNVLGSPKIELNARNIIKVGQLELPREKTVIINFPHGLNPNWDVFNFLMPVWWAYDIGSVSFMFESAFLCILSNGTVVPWMAESYEYLENYMKLRLRYKEGIKWQDGTPFTADDVVFTWDIMLQYGEQVSGGPYAREWIEAVYKEDDRTVLFVFKKPNPRFHHQLTAYGFWGGLVVPKHIFDGKDPTTFKFSDPIGTGPYKLIHKEQELYIWQKDPNWWGKKYFGEPVPEYIVYKYVPAKDVKMMMLANHELDVCRDLLSEDYEAVKIMNPNVTAWRDEPPYFFPWICPGAFYLNCQKYPWNNPLVRRAISLFINKTKVQEAANPRAGPPVEWFWASFPSMMKYVPKDVIEKYGSPVEYNPAKGHAILESLGWRRGEDGIYVTENGTRMENIIIYGYDINIITDLVENGFGVISKPTTHAPAFFATWRAGTWDMLIAWDCPGVSDPYFAYNNMHSKWVKPIGEPVASHHTNAMRWVNATFDALVDELATIPSDSPRGLEILRQLAIIYIQEQPTIPTIQSVLTYVFDNYYWTNWPSEKNPYSDPFTHAATAVLWTLNIRPVERKPPLKEVPAAPVAVGVPTEIVIVAVVASAVIAVGATAAIMRRQRRGG